MYRIQGGLSYMRGQKFAYPVLVISEHQRTELEVKNS
jgi:hypothetical protein